LKRGRSTGKPTAAQAERFELIRENGCVACLIYGLETWPEIHHLTVGGRHGQKRRGHDYTIGLCSWHHQGNPGFNSRDMCELVYGPSYALQPKLFRETFGQDDFLLAYQNRLIGQSEAA
jgi:hypothetical protein